MGDDAMAPTVEVEDANDDAFDTQSASDAATLASCMNDKGRKMYGTERCGHCKQQKEAFGTDFASVEYIDCDADSQACTQAGIQ